METTTRTYKGLTGTQAFDGYAGLRIGKRYTGIDQGDGTVLVSLVGAAPGTGTTLKAQEWERWFERA